MPTENPDISLAEHEYVLRAKREWEQTFDAVTDMVFIVDPDCNIVRANRATAERCGLTPKELVGRKCFEVLHDVTSIPEYCPRAGLLDLGESRTMEFKSEQLHGIFEVSMSPLLNEEGQVMSIVHVARDISEKKQKEELLAAQQEQLASFNRDLETRIAEAAAELLKKDEILIQQSCLTAMGDLANSVAHQWRQPLNSIALIVQSLQLAYKANDLTVEEFDAEIAETMEILQQVAETIDDFRNFFSHEKEPHTFSVNDAVKRAINFVTPSLKTKGIKIVCVEQSDSNIVGYADEYAHVLLNVFINARDVLQDSQQTQPLISVNMSEENGRSIVTIRDNGGGINEEDLSRIFDPHFTRKAQAECAGFGLYLSKMVIEKKMNGSLSVRNVDDGAEFRIEV